jgi:outer membrane receptor protein involved in Fe transport
MGELVAVTNDQGQYRFPSLPPGEYRIVYELAGFTTVVRERIVVNVGFSATLNVQLSLGTIQETLTVSGQSPVVDTQNTNVQTNFTLEMMKSLPNARDIWALIAIAPGTTMSAFDVGGSRAGTQTGYSAYGRGGQVRVQVDGANATEGTGGTGYFNYGAFEEVQIGTDSNDASMPSPGVQINAVIRSGGNDFRGELYVDYEHEKLQQRNVTEALQRVGVGEGSRITSYYDPNIAVGGPIRKDKFWYFVSAKNQRIGTTVTGFPAEGPSDFEFVTKLENITDKLTYQLGPNHKLSHFLEVRRKLQPSRDASSTRYSDAVFKQESMSSYGTVDWNAIVGPSFFYNVRASSWGYNWPNYAYGTGGLGADIQHRRSERQTGNVAGGAFADRTYRRRWQFDWTGTLFKDAWLGGNHAIKIGYLSEWETEKNIDDGYRDAVLLQFDSPAGAPDFTVPWRVTLYNTPKTNINRLWHHGAYIQDQINVNANLTINAGLRWDYYEVYYPDMIIRESPFRDFFYAGARLPNGYAIPASFPSFEVPARRDIIRFPRAIAPRLGIAWDLRGDGKTVLKANWGRYYFNQGPAGTVNPIQTTTYVFNWIDRNADRLFSLTELGTFVSSSGGVSNSISPDLEHEYVDDTSVFLERELTTDLSARVGFVSKVGRHISQNTEIARLGSLFTNARTFSDPGADGIAGTADDGEPFIGWDIPSGVTIPPSRTDLRTPGDIESSDRNIEVTVNKRMSRRWSALASFLYNWDHGRGHPQNPNQERFNETNLTGWAFKAFGTYQAPWNVIVSPILRHQSGANLSRVVQVSLRTGTLSYAAEAPGTYRSDHITIFDARVEKRIPLTGTRDLSLFVDVFNITNSNAATARDSVVGRRTVTLASGEAVNYQRFLRPTNILPPRVYRLGVKFAF